MSTKFSNEQLAGLNKVELRELCRNNGIGYNGLNNDGMRVALMTVAGDEVAVETAPEVPVEVAPEPALVTAPREPKVLPTLVAPEVPVAKPVKERKIQANRPEANGVKRPSDGTICAQIWAWCDEVHGAGDKVTAKELRDALPALDDTTKTVQYYRWRKFNGIQGRQ